MPKYLVRGWVNFSVEAENEIEAAEKVNQRELEHRDVDGWGIEEVQDWRDEWDA